MTPVSPRSGSWRLLAAALLTCVVAVWVVSRMPPVTAAPDGDAPVSQAALRKGDRVAWVGSSSTRIGVWPRTVEFLVRTRHPRLGVEFQRFTTGGGTFASGLAKMGEWLGGFRPTLVVFNYGGNDAGAGREGLPRFKENMARCVERARGAQARVILVTPQAADVRRSGAVPAANRTLYAETMLAFGREHGWPVIDVHHPLEALQKAGERAEPKYTILKDRIHLTDAAYVGWGYLFYDRLDLPFVRSAAALSAEGRVTASENCEVLEVESTPGLLSFSRIDRVLPILPPGKLPPRFLVPLEAQSRYLLTVSGLRSGTYDIACEGRPVGAATAAELAAGVNLNTLLLDSGHEAPWAALAKSIWEGRKIELVGHTRWRFEVRKR